VHFWEVQLKLDNGTLKGVGFQFNRSQQEFEKTGYFLDLTNACPVNRMRGRRSTKHRTWTADGHLNCVPAAAKGVNMLKLDLFKKCLALYHPAAHF
jgi:hypothetical protein